MANAGNTLEETIGLLTAGTEITRSANRVSNGLKTINKIVAYSSDTIRKLRICGKLLKV